MVGHNVEYFKKLIHEMPNTVLISRIDEFQKLHDNDEVYKLVLWNDVDKLLHMMRCECVERVRELVEKDIG